MTGTAGNAMLQPQARGGGNGGPAAKPGDRRAVRSGPISLGAIVAGHLAGLCYDDLPDATVRAAKRLILDTIGVAWAGAAAPGCPAVFDRHRAAGGAPEASVWSTGVRLPAASAALVNGTFAAALDFDSLHNEAVVHPEIVTLPAALAMAERGRCSGRHLIAALVAGSDLACRIGRATPQEGEWFVTSTAGALAAAASAGILLRLDAGRMRDALGLALCQSSGTVQAVLQRTLAKRLQSAFAARNGVEAALLAAAGIDGPREVFDGQGGYFAAFGGGNAEALVDGLGTRFESDETGIKKYPSCACNHAAIEATCRIVREQSLQSDDVRRISVRLSPFMMKIVGAPFDPGGAPQVTGQFSAAYSVASAVQRGGVGLGDLTADAVRDPAIARLIERIELVEDPDNRGLLMPATVVLETADGTYSATVDVMPGSPQAPLSDADLVQKFRDCVLQASPALSPDRIDEMAATILSLEEVNDVAGLARCWPVAG